MPNLLDRIEMAALTFVPFKPVVSALEAPIASFTFDDAPKSAVRAGAAILEERGARGTFYLCGANAGTVFEGSEQFEREDLVALHEAGHELACHSHGHMRMWRRDAAEMDGDLDRNEAYLGAVSGRSRLSSFAYPYGANDWASKRHAARRFETARGVVKGVNAGLMDFADLKTLPIERRKFSLAMLSRQIELAKALNGWIVFYTHDVAEDCTPYGCTPDQLRACVDAVRAAGIEILRVDAAAERVRGEED
jgi:peptidoglycan/xylan/chitin deacetylase (PgdA/CDA1 family)